MKYIFFALIFLSQANSLTAMNWLFKKDHTKQKNDLADLQAHLLIRKYQDWAISHNDISENKKNSLNCVTYEGIISSSKLHEKKEVYRKKNNPVQYAKDILSLQPARYKLLSTEEEREHFFMHFFNFRSNITPLDKETHTLFEMLNITSEMLYEESDESRSRIDQLNIIKSELDNILLKLENNPTLLTWYCIKTDLRLKQKAFLKQLRNLHAQDRLIYYQVDELKKEPAQLNPEEKRKLSAVRVNSLKELNEKSLNEEDKTSARPKLIKRTESQKIKDFLSTFIMDSNNNIISTAELYTMYPYLVISDEQKKEIKEINQKFVESTNSGQAAIDALMDAFDYVKIKTGAIKKLKGHVRKIPSRVEWMTENKLQQFKEAAEEAEALQQQYAQQRSQGKQPVHFKKNPKFPNNNNKE